MITYKQLTETQSEILYLGVLQGHLEKPFRGGYLVFLYGNRYEFTEAEKPKIHDFIRRTVEMHRYWVYSEEKILNRGYRILI